MPFPKNPALEKRESDLSFVVVIYQLPVFSSLE